jgi:hypothetical protein
MKMKTVAALGLAVAALFGPLAEARDMFQMSWKGTIHYYDSNGRAVTKSFTDRDVVQKLATDAGVDPRDYVLVYRPDALDTAVVSKSTGDAIDFLQLPDISNPAGMTEITGNGTTFRQAFLYDENSNPIGTIVGSERQKMDANGNIVSDSYRGTFQYAIPDDGNHKWTPGVYSGTFATGKRIPDAAAASN